tara:strand:- start:544 stop:741 length:198 start_codon:yes stop_codon:yes gene_type:complete
MEPQVSTVLKIQRLPTRGENVMPKKKKKPTKKKSNKKPKRELEGYYIPGDGTIKVIYRKNGGLSI